MRAARSKRNIGSAQLALLLAAGCSLQNFDYLQQGSGGSSAAGTSSSSAGSSTTAGTDSGEGGEAAGAATGGNGGTAPSGGTKSGGSNSGGSVSGDGGKAGSGGKGGAGGSGATGELVNGSFETNNTVGWSVDPEDSLAVRHAFIQDASVVNAVVPDGKYEFSIWHATDDYSVDLYQTIEGLEDGVYVLKAYFNLGTGHTSVELYATNCGAADPEPTPVLPADAAAWTPVTVEGIRVKGGKCTVGLRIETLANKWLNADWFTFEVDPNATPGGAGGAGGDSGQGGAN